VNVTSFIHDSGAECATIIERGEFGGGFIKAFGNLKEQLNMRRNYVSSEESLEGKVFVQFIALIYLS